MQNHGGKSGIIGFVKATARGACACKRTVPQWNGRVALLQMPVTSRPRQPESLLCAAVNPTTIRRPQSRGRLMSISIRREQAK